MPLLPRQRKSASGPVEERDLDARPSDAINLAVRFGAPIFVSADVAKSCGGRTPVPAASPSAGGGAAAFAPRARAPPTQLDNALELRVRMALAVAEGREADAARLRDEVAAALGGAASGEAVSAAAAAALMLEVELAVKEERYADAAAARDRLAAMGTFLSAAPDEGA